MGVVNLPTGQPTTRLTGGAATRLAAITPAGTDAFIHLELVGFGLNHPPPSWPGLTRPSRSCWSNDRKCAAAATFCEETFRLDGRVKPGHDAKADSDQFQFALTITDEPPLAQAFVIIEAR
jgi:hypothetical protein